MTGAYFRMSIDIYTEYGILKSPQLANVSFVEGSPISLPAGEPLVFEANYPSEREPDHLMGDEIPVVSDYFLECLRICGVDNFQDFPAVVRNPNTGKQWTNFKAFNVVGLVDAVDESASTSDVIVPGGEGGPPELVEFRELGFLRSRTHDLPMFRIPQNPGQFFLIDCVMAELRQRRPAGGWGFVTFEVPVR